MNSLLRTRNKEDIAPLAAAALITGELL